MSQDKRKLVTRTLTILGIVLGSSLAFFATLVVALGVSQPLMLVASDSMAPTISVGDVVAIRSAGPSGVHLGDVILFQKSLTQFRILHRVVCIVTSNSSSCTLLTIHISTAPFHLATIRKGTIIWLRTSWLCYRVKFMEFGQGSESLTLEWR